MIVIDSDDAAAACGEINRIAREEKRLGNREKAHRLNAIGGKLLRGEAGTDVRVTEEECRLLQKELISVPASINRVEL